ncbi:MAG: hypothetical protein K5986_07695 [Clostridium sp.]|uniref:hypothetical protein n=1 Tax=Clostridium sp. DSM 8431 TaxID=1761781 RepID=UPI0008F1C885|nr:hypothetical protein [Clostridium sp. DSM 8431]MCR4944317.1 hypothetical protein [Clostridium sp.]SFU89599.1 hypothetical protein SAMN04487886_12913 [Clostridium sp. DSM 8431]
METKRERNARLFLNLSGGLLGIRQLISYFSIHSMLYELNYPKSITVKEALKLVENINENSYELDFDEEDMDLQLIYNFLNVTEKENKLLLDMYMDYLEDKIREE